MRLFAAVLLLFSSLNLSATTIQRLNPASFYANSGEHFLTIYGSGLAGPVVYSGASGEYKVDISSGGDTSAYVWVPLELLYEPGEVKVTVGDASAILRILAEPAGPLQIQGGDPIVVPAEGRWGAKVEYEVHVIGGQDPNPTVTCKPPSGSIFPLGPSHVQCVAENRYGERAEGGRYIYVADYGVPIVKVPDRIRVEATSPQGAYVEFTATATDDIDGDLPVTCDPKSGSLFPVGETTVECVATDSSLNPGKGEFIVEVVAGAKEELLLKLPDPIVAEATRPDGAYVEYEVTAYGTSDPHPAVECDPRSESLFPVGETTVKCNAYDSLGNRAEGSFTVTVQDTMGPVIYSISATPNELKPNMKWNDVKIDLEVADVVDPSPRCHVVDVTTNYEGGGMEIAGELSVRLLGERDPKLGDRQYDIRVECTDATKNVSESFTTVLVPKDQSPDSSEPVTAPTTKKWIGIRSKG
jgi:hypothetical protein